MPTDAQNIIAYLKNTLTDPSGRGYPTIKGLHWIYVSKPNFEFSSVGYPIIYTSLSNDSNIEKRMNGWVDKHLYSINVFSTKISDIDNLKTQLITTFKNITQSDIPGLYDFKIESTPVTENVIEDLDVYQLIFNISFRSYEI